MTPKTVQCEVFWALMSNPKHSGVLEDSKSPTLGVLGFTPTLGQSGVATFVFGYTLFYKSYILSIINLWPNFKDSQFMSIPMQLEVEVQKLYASTITNLEIQLTYLPCWITSRNRGLQLGTPHFLKSSNQRMEFNEIKHGSNKLMGMKL
jgi:hypothetical protein